MSIQNILDRATGAVGDVVKYNGHTYKKARNGKWGLVVTDTLRKRVIKYYADSTMRDTATKFGISHSTVQSIVNKGGASKGKAALIHTNKARLRDNDNTIVRLYLKGKSLREIADYIGLSEYTKLISVLEANGVTLRTARERATLFIDKAKKSGRLRALVKHNAALASAYKLTFSSYSEYSKCVRRLTSSVLCKWGYLIDPKNKRSYEYHVDHQLSIFDGWHVYSTAKNKYVKRLPPVPLLLMCHPENLKIMPGSTNMKKHSSSHVELGQLYRKVRLFEKKYGNAFDPKVY